MPLKLLSKIATGIGVGLMVAGTAAAQEIPAGWSVETKPKGAILTHAPEKDAPRYLIVACLRDTDEIGVYSTGIGVPSSKPVVVMQLTNAGRKYSLRGDMGQDNISHEPAFRYETNIDARALSIFRAEFMPMLAGKGPLNVTVGEKSQQDRKSTRLNSSHTDISRMP